MRPAIALNYYDLLILLNVTPERAPAYQLFQSPVFSLRTLPVLFFRRVRGPAAAEKVLDDVSLIMV
jgi:hypothetical protein